MEYNIVNLILDISIFSWLKLQKYSWEISAYIIKVKMHFLQKKVLINL